MRQTVWGVLLTSLVSTSALAQEPAAAGRTLDLRGAVAASFTAPAVTPAAQTPAAEPEPKKWTLLVGADVPLLGGYFFRGIQQEFDPKLTIQPYVDFGYALSDSATLNIGTWNSFHTGSNSDSFDDGGLNAPFYESDFYASVTFVAGKTKPGVLFTSYTSPDDAFKTVNELALFVTFDDSASSVPLSPKLLVAFELGDNQADSGHLFGGDKGTYFEASVGPTFKSSEDSPVTFTVPIKLGMSLNNYYEFFNEDGDLDDSKFGYFQFGVKAGIPLSGITMGSWEFHGGIDFLVFPEDRKVFQEGDDEGKSFKPVLNFGFSAAF